MAKTKLSPVDKEAIGRAIAIMRASGPDRAEQIDQLLAEDDWQGAADLAVYHCQRPLIAPRLWQRIPADIDPDQVDAILARGEDKGGEYQAARLVRKLLRAGLSKYEPQPLQRLAEIKAQRQAASEPDAAA
jgi:hypothetical protein